MSTLFIEVSGLYLAGHPPASPAVVVQKKMVVDACPVSLLAGITVGMGVGQARAILHDLTVHEYRESLYSLEWVYELCSVSDSIEVVSPHQAFVDLSGHLDPFLTALELVERLSFEARGSVSPCKWVAQSLSPASGLLHHPSPYHSLSSVSLQYLTPIPLEVRERLAFLGYRTIGEIQTLSLGTLRSHFGGLALTIRQAAMGCLHEAPRANFPRASITLRQMFEGGCEDLQSIHSAIDLLSKRLAHELCETDQEAKAIELVIYGEYGAEQCRRQFGKALRSALRIQTALMALWSEMSYESPVLQLRCVLHEVANADRRQIQLSGLLQKDAMMPSDAVDRLSAKYGSGAVIPGSQIKVPRRKEVLRVLRATTGWY